MFQIKTIEDIPIAYVAKQGHPAVVAGRAFWELEQRVPLKGNKFYGVFDERTNEYRACVALSEANQDSAQGLNRGVIQGGAYAYTTIVGDYRDIVRQVGPAFDELARSYRRDPARPCVEFYKRHTEVLVMLPVQQ
ncbi:GyrI-like domain-containing protein [Candidatus Parcubacteria bacterium]|nr:GyrI-like domain-containing protein [Candidatus Parcubacteria bacterium]